MPAAYMRHAGDAAQDEQEVNTRHRQGTGASGRTHIDGGGVPALPCSGRPRGTAGGDVRYAPRKKNRRLIGPFEHKF